MQPETGPLPLLAQRHPSAYPMASTTTPRSFYAAEPSTPGTPSEKTRVLVSGPGGADTKQGAKIACLECRSAKIKCSAPTDGHVPCKRCVKHGKECLFEKHKRGRKPNKRFSVPSSGLPMEASGSQDGDATSGGDVSLQHHARARSSDGLREATASVTGHARPNSSGQPPQYVHQTSRDPYFAAAAAAEGDNRYRSWANAEPSNRPLDHPMQPWQYPAHIHHAPHHQAQQPQQPPPQQQQQQLLHLQQPQPSPQPPPQHLHQSQHHYQHQKHPQHPQNQLQQQQQQPPTQSQSQPQSQPKQQPQGQSPPSRTGDGENAPRHPHMDLPSTYHTNGQARPPFIPSSGATISGSTVAPTSNSQSPSGPDRQASQQPQHQPPASTVSSTAALHARHGGEYGGPTGRWKEPGASHPTNSPSGGASSGKTGFAALGSPPHANASAPNAYSHGRNRSYGQGGPAPSHNYLHWDSQLGSQRGQRGRGDQSRSPNGGSDEGRHAKGAPADYEAEKRGDSRPYFHSGGGSDDGHGRTNGVGRKPDASSSLSSPHRPRPLGLSPHPPRPWPLRDEQTSAQRQQHGASGAAAGRNSNRWNHLDDQSGPHPAVAASSQPDDADIELEDEQDELDDDADATREEHDNVLSNPLKLLAQASDAAAARIEGGRLESGGRNSLAAAETMGLLIGGSSSSKMAMSAAVNLTGLGRPLYNRSRADEMMPPQGWSSSRILPPLVQQNSSRDAYPDRGSRLPMFLGSINRSKSYPSAESLHGLDASAAAAASASLVEGSGELRAPQEHLLSVRDADLGRPNAITPSTLDHDAWEYREGKAQTRRGYAHSGGAGGSPSTMSHGGQTASSATSVGFPASARAHHGDSPLNLGASPSEEPRANKPGKRKRSRSRLARIHRRRRLNDRDSDAEGDPDASGDDTAPAAPRGKDKQVSISESEVRKDGVGSGSGGEGEAGASRKGYFNLSLFHSKNDDEEGLDPVELGLVELTEVERLFDLFFARINPVLDLFDPFLHSVSFVRMRSAFLTTVIACMAARFSDTVRDARIATVLDRHWQNKLLPMILLGGYKSVEISQAFLILTTYSRPTSRLVDDRSWQYLGFAIRTATEVGVNRKVTPSESLLGNEQVSRRVRNRERLWFNLFLYDRTLSAQTGRPWTISEDRMIVQSSMWHRQDFALPEDVSLVSLIKLRRIAAQHLEAFDNYLSSQDHVDAARTATVLNAGEQGHLERRLAGLEFFRRHANADLEKWKESWCINTDEKIRAVDTSTAAGKYLVRWAPTAKLFYYHSRLIINSLVLGTTEQHEGLVSGSSASVECWTSAISLIDTVLNDFDEESVIAWSNDRVVMAVYAAVSALRLTNLAEKYPFADKETAIALVRRLSAAMTKAGKTPKHRNGSATPYGRYLKSVLAIFEPDVQGSVPSQTTDKDSENAMSATTSSLAPGDSGSQVVSPAEPSCETSAAAERPGPSTGDGAPTRDADRSGSPPEPDGIGQQAAAGVVTVASPGRVPEGGDGARSTDDSTPLASSTTNGKVPRNPDKLVEASDTAGASNEGPSVVTPLVKMEEALEVLGSSINGVKPDPISPSAVAPAPTAAALSAIGSSAAPTSSAKAAVPGLPGLDGDLAILDTSKLAANLPLEAWAASGPSMTNAPGSEPRASATQTDAAAATLSVLDSSAHTTDPAVLTIATAAAAAGGQNASGMPFGGGEVAVDDPDSIDRLWDCLTAFEPQGFSGAFWQPPSTWNVNGGGGGGGTS
ncbi:hypothetical protein ACQY0O_001402 [Thecaphora frezii]